MNNNILHKIVAQRTQVQGDCFCIKYQCSSYEEAKKLREVFHHLNGEVRLTIGAVVVILDKDTPKGQED